MQFLDLKNCISDLGLGLLCKGAIEKCSLVTDQNSRRANGS